MNVTYRSGRQEDSFRLAELINIASDGAVEYLFHDLVPNLKPVQLVASNLENDNYPHSFRSTIVAESDGKLVGMALSFPAQFHRITDEMNSFFPPDRLEHFKHFFSSRVENSYFLDALCVDDKYRKKGIGNELMSLTKEKAKENGYGLLSLIVFADNVNAIRFYKNRNFEVEKNVELKKHELIPHEGGCLLMKCKPAYNKVAARDH